MATPIRMRHALAVALGMLFVASSAAADPSFPAELEKDWAMPCLPKCTVCHLTQQGGYGTLRSTTKGDPGFGANLKSNYDLNVSDLSSIHSALTGAKTDETDVDGDGKSDFAELAAGEDPNEPGPGSSSICSNTGPVFGCVRVARPGAIDGVGGTLAALTSIVLAARLRRRRRA